jgi:hypothetical protein
MESRADLQDHGLYASLLSSCPEESQLEALTYTAFGYKRVSLAGDASQPP